MQCQFAIFSTKRRYYTPEDGVGPGGQSSGDGCRSGIGGEPGHSLLGYRDW